MICAFDVLGPPQPKERARAGLSGRHFTPKRTRAYEQLVGTVAELRRPATWPLDARYHVELRVYFGDARARDVDNVAKSILDGLNRVLWRDDRQVMRIVVEKSIDRQRPRVEIVAALVPKVTP